MSHNFADLIFQLQLFDLELPGRRFTWSNARANPTLAKLDRFLFNLPFSNCFPNVAQSALPNTSSDHLPLLCTIQTNFMRSNLFRVENFFLKLPHFQDLVRNFWLSRPVASTPSDFDLKLSALTKEIKLWKKSRSSAIMQQLRVIRNFLAWCDWVMEIRNLTELEKLVKALMKKRFVQLAILEEELWKQRASVKWKLHGDKNTTYFHARASSNKRKNFIQKIAYNGDFVSDQKSKGRAFHNFFCQLIGKHSVVTSVQDWSMLYPTHLNLSSNLTQPVTQEEISIAIKAWPNGKSPGPDGYTGEFFKLFLDELMPDILTTLNSALNIENLSPLNNSLICLIPKKPDASHPSDFRPIGIVHSMQRILSKVLMNRFTPLVQNLINPNHSGFLPGRNIVDNFLYAQQVITHASRKKIKLAVFKADLRKAFDTISWVFIQNVLLALGFPNTWTKWITGCVLKGSSKVMVNGLASKKIILRRGVRQGDPLSPYLFIVAFDFLSRWMNRLTTVGAFPMPHEGMLPCLFYADDSLIFFKPDTHQALLLKLLLAAFESTSGLALNHAKSALICLNCEEQTVTSLSRILACISATLPITYLGLPLSNKSLRKSDYGSLLSKFQARLSGWPASLLSIAGRAVLVNTCLSSLPIYFMSAFKLPAWVLKRIDAIRRNFMWHGCNSTKLVLISWDKVCMPKAIGGSGILDLQVMNDALLAKWLWIWLSKENSIWSNLNLVLQNGNFSTFPSSGQLQNNFSKMIDLFSTVLKFQLGDGIRVPFWHFDWGFGILKHKFHTLFTFSLDTGISVQYFQQNSSDTSKLFKSAIATSDLVLTQLAQVLQILHITSVSPSLATDKAVWTLQENTLFSTKSLHSFIKMIPKHNSTLKEIWKLKIPPRMIIFLWRMLQNRIATVDTLRKRGWPMPSICYLCRNGEDSVQHLFNECRYTLQAKHSLFCYPHNLQLFQIYTTLLLLSKSPQVPVQTKELLAIMTFLIWRERCQRIFNEKHNNLHFQALVDQTILERDSYYVRQ
ncbi:RNA-directed DNA polymerase (reverse transcriptase)-related family protein [Rhynchospora pubera]|uniref:RNA-directed DNA polymerase (Reverse transcriptase)-related family protein n=1 Tax=Rhynchospora pubera TaxID=906938 RepID=A0AAV8BYD7_9POAL|nr:RNA-directed DNA polymerase (reverse transcriptase)-related family protein [Rhynchospora pubera]